MEMEKVLLQGEGLFLTMTRPKEDYFVEQTEEV
jgi:hypothetical protein